MPQELEHAKAQADTYTRLYSILLTTREQFAGIPLEGEYSIAEAIKETLKPEEVQALVKALSDNGYNPVESN